MNKNPETRSHAPPKLLSGLEWLLCWLKHLEFYNFWIVKGCSDKLPLDCRD